MIECYSCMGSSCISNGTCRDDFWPSNHTAALTVKTGTTPVPPNGDSSYSVTAGGPYTLTVGTVDPVFSVAGTTYTWPTYHHYLTYNSPFSWQNTYQPYYELPAYFEQMILELNSGTRDTCANNGTDCPLTRQVDIKGYIDTFSITYKRLAVTASVTGLSNPSIPIYIESNAAHSCTTTSMVHTTTTSN
jgi:hypothetical protein